MRWLFGALLVTGLAVMYWQWVLAAIVIVLLVKAIPPAYREFQRERAAEQSRLQSLIHRADQQHQWVSAGDARGVYGAFPPAI